MNKKWNLQDIQPPDRDPNKRRAGERSSSSRPASSMQTIKKQTEVLSHHNDTEKSSMPNNYNGVKTATPKQKSGKKLMLFASFIFIVSLISAFAIGNLTSGAEITIYPKVRSMNINADITAYNENKTGELSYEILTLEAVGEREMTATGQEDVSIQTEGEIDIYKTTIGNERLIKNTRFETEAGLIFRIQESVVIPGATKNEIGDLVPGVIKVKVFADEPGEQYNIPAKTKLRIPGFAESNLTDLYNSVYAENPDSFVGGFNGRKFVIDETELSNAQNSLRNELKDVLYQKADSERPADYAMFIDSATITYTTLPTIQKDGSQVLIKEQATLRIPLFRNEDFASFLAKETIVGYESGETVRIDNIDKISFEYLDLTTKLNDLSALESITFKAIGQPVFVWTYESEGLKDALVGKEKTALPLALSQYSQESRSSVKIRPFWKSTFPEDVQKISITEVLTES